MFQTDASKLLLEIWEGGDESPERPVKLDETTLKYLKVDLKQVTFTYSDVDKTETRSHKSFPVKICPVESYKTDYEKKFYDLNKDNHLLCADNKEVFLQGTRDSRVSKKDHSYLVYEFKRCQGEGCAEP